MVEQRGSFKESLLPLNPCQCRAARGLLDWTQAELADRAEVSRSTIRDFEGNRHDVHRATAAQLRRAFEEGGASFPEIGEGCVGVCPKNGSVLPNP